MLKVGKIKFKLCIFGDGGVGKTTLTQRYLTQVFDEDLKMTIGADFSVKELEIEGKTIVLRIWDFAGEDRFRVLLPSFAKGADGGIFMFDLTRRGTLERTEEWLTTFKRGLSPERKDVPILLVGGKLDLTGQIVVLQKEAETVMQQYNLFDYIQCSSKTGENLKLIFESLLKRILKYLHII